MERGSTEKGRTQKRNKENLEFAIDHFQKNKEAF
jgi:hypothetical protein